MTLEKAYQDLTLIFQTSSSKSSFDKKIVVTIGFLVIIHIPFFRPIV